MKCKQISLAAARVNAQMTQDEVAKIMQKSNRTISNWENGKQRIDAANLLMLADIYDIPVDMIKL